MSCFRLFSVHFVHSYLSRLSFHVFFLVFSDSYLDLAGSMNDLGAYHTILLQFDLAEKVLKRALMMVVRSHKINQELQISILTNMAEMYRAKGEDETALLYADRVLQLINGNLENSDVERVQGQGQGNHKNFVKVKPTSPTTLQSTSPFSPLLSPPLIYSTQIFSSLRKSQIYLVLGKVISQCRHLQEGVVYTSMAFEKSLVAQHGFLYSPLLLETSLKDVAIQKLSNNAVYARTTLDKDYLALYCETSPYSGDDILGVGINSTPSQLIQYLQKWRAKLKDCLDSHVDDHSEKIMKETSALYDLALKIEEGSKGSSNMDVMSKSNVTGVIGLALLDLDYYYQQHLIATRMEKDGDFKEREAFRSMLGLTNLDE